MNYKLKIQYDGTNYSGWQIQNNAVTVQQKITEAINSISKINVNLIGSGRTDTGVHALGQTANFKTEIKLNIYKFKHSLNAVLPNDISIVSMEEAEEEFHSRFSAKKRSYIYLFSKNKSPFFYKYSYFINEVFNINYLNRISKSILGKNDFTSFARKKTETKNKNCNIYDIHWKETAGRIFFYIEADRFLHGMVRTIVGTFIEAHKNMWEEEHIKNIIENKDRCLAGEAVPAKGLFLYKVKY